MYGIKGLLICWKIKRIIVIDGGPRKNANTAALIEKFTEGVKSKDETIEVKHIRLYDIDYHGCRSCLACKLKKSKSPTVCSFKDGITPVLQECQEADGLVFASPIYFGDVTAQLHAFMERLFFPWFSYDNNGVMTPKRRPTAVIYTMNSSKEQRYKIGTAIDRFNGFIEAFLQKPESVEAYNTVQVKNYDMYAMTLSNPAFRHAYREEYWAEDLQKAFEAGVQMVAEIR
ncbi:MAG: flavodoxin family protein [Prevotella sp.]